MARDPERPYAVASLVGGPEQLLGRLLLVTDEGGAADGVSGTLDGELREATVERARQALASGGAQAAAAADHGGRGAHRYRSGGPGAPGRLQQRGGRPAAGLRL